MSVSAFLLSLLSPHGPLLNLWPLLALPALAALLADKAVATDRARHASWRTIAVLAAAPGLLAIACALVPWAQILSGREPVTWRGVVLWRLTPLVGLLLLARAGWRAFERRRQIRRVLGCSREPDARLAGAARRVGVTARELPGDALECFVVSARPPCVLISSGTLQKLDDETLHAALAHEAAHIRQRDLVLFSVLRFLGDLCLRAPRKVQERLTLLRELQADRHAAGVVGSLAVAEALVRVAAARSRVAAALPLSNRALLEVRIRALLDPSSDAQGRGDRFRLAAGAAVAAVLVGVPLLQHGVLMHTMNSRRACWVMLVPNSPFKEVRCLDGRRAGERTALTALVSPLGGWRDASQPS